MSKIISLICTVHNEEEGLKGLLDSIRHQSKKVDEIIFIEDSSSDKTFQILEDYNKKYNCLKIIQVKTKNIAKNRKIAVKKSKGAIIVCVDAGCKLDKKYVERITFPFNSSNIDFVGGTSRILSKTLFGKCFASFIEKKDISKDYLPKGHAMAFRKNLWKRVGGFPEHLARGAEDTYFGRKAIQIGCSPFIVGDAVIYWKSRENLREIFKQFKNYGYWDKRAFSFQNLPKNSKLNILFSIVFPLAILYSLFKGGKLLIQFRSVQAFIYGLTISLTKIYGYSIGLVKGMLK